MLSAESVEDFGFYMAGKHPSPLCWYILTFSNESDHSTHYYSPLRSNLAKHL